MSRIFDLYASLKKKAHFNKPIATNISMFLSTHHPEGNPYPNWHIGVGEDEEPNDAIVFNCWECPSHEAALDTISYFVDEKHILKVNSETEADSKRICLYLKKGERGY